MTDADPPKILGAFVLGLCVGMLVTLAASEHGQHIRELDAAAEGAHAMIIRCAAAIPDPSTKAESETPQ